MLLNIVILNYEYEIIALGVSSRMLVAATVLFLIYARDYTAFFWGGRPRAAQEPRPFGRRVILAGAIAKYAVVIYGLYTFLPLMWPGAGFRAKPELYGKWHVESVTTANSQGVVPSAFAPGSIWYFNVSKSFAVRTQDTVRTGTYDFEPRNRHTSRWEFATRRAKTCCTPSTVAIGVMGTTCWF